MKNYNVSKTSTLTLDEKLEMIEEYTLHDLENILEDIKSFPEEYEKQVEIAVYNKLFEYGVTSI